VLARRLEIIGAAFIFSLERQSYVYMLASPWRDKVTYAYDSYELPYYVENVKANMYLLVCG
jgi:hypothetical protein